MNKELDGPMKSAFESDTKGVIMQELTTYRIAQGMLRIEKTQRRFTNDGKDYNDSSSITPLGKVTNA
jgi:hypothetical protein